VSGGASPVQGRAPVARAVVSMSGKGHNSAPAPLLAELPPGALTDSAHKR